MYDWMVVAFADHMPYRIDGIRKPFDIVDMPEISTSASKNFTSCTRTIDAVVSMLLSQSLVYSAV